MRTDCGESKKGNGCALDYFEKNAYFHGKLITARDMIAEQKVGEDKLHMINRLTIGDGIVCGLKVESLEKKDGKFKVKIQPGMAIDCCGRILVVKSEGGAITKEVTRFEDGGGTNPKDTVYLYLRYKECRKEAVPIPGAGDACEEKCCYNRILEVFDVVYKDAPLNLSLPPEVSFPSKADSEEDRKAAMLRIAQDYYDQNLKDSCKECTEHMVFLGTLKKSGSKWILNEDAETETKKYLTVVYNNKMLYDILTRHVTRFDNPHEVTAEQAGAPVSVDGVSNPGGNIDLKKKNAIVIEADDANNTITIGETHSAKEDNPHEVTAEQTRSLTSVNEVGNTSDPDEEDWVRNIDLTPAEYPDDPAHEDNTIEITPEGAENRIKLGVKSNSITTTHIRDNTIVWNKLNEKDVRDKIVRQIGGVTPNPDNGNIDLIEGENIEITSNKDGHAISISCKSKDALPVHMGYCVFKEVGPGEIRISEQISHGLEQGDVGMILADESENQILIGDREHFADVEDFSVSPALAAKVEPKNKTFTIFLKNLDERERIFVVRWWAIQAAKDLGRCKGEHPPSGKSNTGVFDRSSFDQAKFEKPQQSSNDKFNTAKFSRSVFS